MFELAHATFYQRHGATMPTNKHVSMHKSTNVYYPPSTLLATAQLVHMPVKSL